MTGMVHQGRVQFVSVRDALDVAGDKHKSAAILRQMEEVGEAAHADLAKLNADKIQLGKDREALDGDRTALETEKREWDSYKKLEESRLTKWAAAVQKKKDEADETRKSANRVMKNREQAAIAREQAARTLADESRAAKAKAETAITAAVAVKWDTGGGSPIFAHEDLIAEQNNIIIRNRRDLTQGGANNQKVYRDDGVAVYMQGNAYEDQAGGTPYAGRGVERTDRLG